MPINDFEPILKPYSCKNIKYISGLSGTGFRKRPVSESKYNDFFEVLLVKRRVFSTWYRGYFFSGCQANVVGGADEHYKPPRRRGRGEELVMRAGSEVRYGAGSRWNILGSSKAKCKTQAPAPQSGAELGQDLLAQKTLAVPSFPRAPLGPGLPKPVSSCGRWCLSPVLTRLEVLVCSAFPPGHSQKLLCCNSSSREPGASTVPVLLLT